MNSFRANRLSRATPGSHAHRTKRYLCLERLEERAVPTAGGILLDSHNWTTGAAVYHYDQSGNLLGNPIAVPYPGPSSPGEFGRSVGVDAAQNMYVYNGTFNPYLSTYDPATHTWSQHSFPGWSTVADSTFGGLAVFQHYAYVTDMNTNGATADGLIRFDTNDYSAVRFDTTHEYVQVTLGLDGLLYGLVNNVSSGFPARVEVYDPLTLAFKREIVMGAGVDNDIRALAVDANGDLFLGSWNGNFIHCDRNGSLIKTLADGAPSASSLEDIALSTDGKIVASTESGAILFTDESLNSLTGHFNTNLGNFENFVAWDTPQLPSVSSTPASFGITNIRSPDATGIADSFTVSALDQSGSLIPGYRGTVQFTSSDPQAILPAPYTFTPADNGVHSFSFTPRTAGTVTLTVADAALASASSSVNVVTVNDFSTSSWILPAAQILTHSTEYDTLIVTAAYQRFLGRTPDGAGLAGWLAQMHNGLSDEHLEADCIGSTEYIQNHGGAGAAWVTGMYQNLLGRTPSQAEVSQWLRQLTQGVSTTAIAYGFAASAEREGLRVIADYRQYLGRTPGAGEVANWVAAFESGAATNEGVVAGFLGSTEYVQKTLDNASGWFAAAIQDLFGHVATQVSAAPSYLAALAGTLTTSVEHDSDIVIADYQRYLGRLPDSAGLASWVTQLEHGLAIEHLEASLIGSTEYIQKHGGAGAGWVIGLYQDLLGRTPSQAEVNQWLQDLASGVSATAIAYGFAASAEREGIAVAADYQHYLGRSPSVAELAGWVGALESGTITNQGVVADLVGSLEYFQRYNSNTQAWWNQAVTALFGPGRF
jgi:hypothetical protein